MSTPATPPKRKLLDQVRDAIRARHYSYRTEEAYTAWIRRSILPPGPLISIAIEPKAKANEEKLGLSLRQLATEDPSFRVNTDRDTGLTIISGTSELHIEMIVDRLRREFKVDTNVGKPRVVYKETIRSLVEREGKFVRQTGGRGQYSHVVLRVEPLKGEKVFEFADATKTGTMPAEYIAAVEEGVVAAMQFGVLAGYPTGVGIKATLLDGSYHEVDSSEVAFKIAGSMAFKEAAAQAQPIILEPVMSVEVVVPEEFMGNILSDLNVWHGMIEGMESRGDAQVINAQVPLAQMLGYATHLRLRTQGRATYTMEFQTYVQLDSPPEPNGDEPVSMAGDAGGLTRRWIGLRARTGRRGDANAGRRNEARLVYFDVSEREIASQSLRRQFSRQARRLPADRASAIVGW